ncbi:calx-beta domain-containing protein [Trichonephila clavata]|uniref:Calx-beta domain-containing protein n=1 Tax=Trichonephila clavata TaxID=2740835 RepID=A0A8X6G7R6_TRICU|nr:calx-beta domain-containing protein [Trichonephila clavata]
MKPESIKSILHFYLKEKSSNYDDVDGFSCYAEGGRMSSEGFLQAHSEFYVEDTEVAIPQYEEHYVPLDPENEERAFRIGRQLRHMSIEFDSDHMEAVRNPGQVNGTKSIEFKERFMHVSPSCGIIKIPVIQTGSSNGMAKIAWITEDKTAKSGIHYTGSQGSFDFTEGVEEKTIELEIRNQRETDVCFAVKLYDPEGTSIGNSNPVIIYIVDHSKLYEDEKQVIENIFSPNITSIPEVLTCMCDKVTNNTFKAGLQRLCSNADSIPQELYLGSELLRLTLPHANFSTLRNVFCDFFSYLPELEDITEFF